MPCPRRCPVLCAGSPPAQSSGSGPRPGLRVPITYTHDYHTYAFSTHVTLSVCPFSLLGGSWGWWWVHERERGLGCFCAALSFSGEQRTWRLARTRRARLTTPLCAHTGALEPRRVIRYTASPSCKLSCLIFSDQGDPPPSLNLSHCPLATSPSLFARCVGIGESGFASSLYVIYSELNRHGISRKRENAE